MRESREDSLTALGPWMWTGALIGAAMAGGMLLESAFRGRDSFRGKSVLITGSSRGLGLELARQFAREGARLTLIARSEETLEDAKAELEKLGARVLTKACDVRDQAEVESAVQAAASHFGRIDVLVNNAGIMQVGPFEQMTMQDYEDAMATHAWASLYFITAVVPHMKRQGAGRIVNVTSIGAKVGVPHMVPYVMSKFAQAGLSQSIGAELSRHNIKVTTVYPGLMRTGSHVNAMFKGQNEREFAWFSISAGMPIVSMNSRRAARQIVEASRRGRKQLVLTPTAKLATMATGVMPSLVDQGMRLMDKVLPGVRSPLDKSSRTGWESRSRWSPSAFTRLADRAIDRNNEHNEHRAIG